MAAPVEAGSATTSFAAVTDPWTVNYPASIASGDVLLFYARTGAAATFTTVTGFTSLDANNTADASAQVTQVSYRIADGSESGTFSVDMSTTAKGAVIVWRVTGGANQAPDIGTAAVGTSGSNIDPPNVTVTGGPKDVLVFALGGLDGEPPSQDITAVPTNYGTEVTANSGTAGASSSNCVISGASRGLTAVSSENPGTFTNTANSAWYGQTVAIQAPVAATTSLIWPTVTLPTVYLR